MSINIIVGYKKKHVLRGVCRDSDILKKLCIFAKKWVEITDKYDSKLPLDAILCIFKNIKIFNIGALKHSAYKFVPLMLNKVHNIRTIEKSINWTFCGSCTHFDGFYEITDHGNKLVQFQEDEIKMECMGCLGYTSMRLPIQAKSICKVLNYSGKLLNIEEYEADMF